MRAAAFWKTVTLDHSNFLESLVALLEGRGVQYLRDWWTRRERVRRTAG